MATAQEIAVAKARAVKVDRLANAFTTTTLRKASEVGVPIWGHEASRMVLTCARQASVDLWKQVAHDNGIREPSGITIACTIAVLEGRAGL